MDNIQFEGWVNQHPKQKPRNHNRERSQRLRRAKRIRVLRRRIIFGMGAFLFLLIMVFFIHGKISHKNEEVAVPAAEEKKVSDVQVQEKEETLEERVARVKKMAQENNFPADIIELLDKNPETVQFVEEYEQSKNLPIANVVSDNLVKGEIPQFLQWDQRWGYASYGTGFVATCGCGPTCLSMVISGLTGDATITPAVVAKYSDDSGMIDDDNNTYWELMTSAPKHWGLHAENVSISEDTVKEAIADGGAVICSVGPGDFTQIGHFIVLVGYDEGKVKVHDPFNQQNSEKIWEYSKIKDQFKSMWIIKE